MANQLILHQAANDFNSLIKEAADYFSIREVFIDKDYWLTLVLKRLAECEYANSVVFKGGTSLSKGYKLIKRFSEDVDIAVMNASYLSGNQLKTFIRNVEKAISVDLAEIDTPGVTSKGSHFRKTVFTYPVSDVTKQNQSVSNKLIIETNSFANPYPYGNLEIKSMICEFLEFSGKPEIIMKYGLEPFNLNILDKRRTLIEKIVSLIRFSFSENPTISLSEKIRHFYDIYFLLNDKECKSYFDSGAFIVDISKLIKHDRSAFDEPKGWGQKSIKDSPLLQDFDTIWNNIKATYIRELSSLSFSEIPYEKDVEATFKLVILNLGVINF